MRHALMNIKFFWIIWPDKIIPVDLVCFQAIKVYKHTTYSIQHTIVLNQKVNLEYLNCNSPIPTTRTHKLEIINVLLPPSTSIE